MSIKYFFLRLFISFCYSFTATAVESVENKGAVYFNVDSRSYSEYARIHSLVHSSFYSFVSDFNGNINKGDHAFTNNLLEIGARYTNLSVSYIARYDQFYAFNDDTARLFYEIKNNLPQTVGPTYKLQMKANFISATGIKLAYGWKVNDVILINSALSYLSANEFFDNQSSGSTTFQDDNSFSGDGRIHHIAERDMILEHPVNPTEGRGYAVDIGIHWTINPQWQLHIQLLDAVSAIHWRDALDSQLNLTTATRIFDVEDNLSVAPALSGRQVLRNYTQRLPKKLITKISYKLNNQHSIFTETYHTDYFTHSQLGYEFMLTQHQAIALSWNIDTEAAGINYQNDYVLFGIFADSLHYKKAHAISITMGLNIPL